MADTAAQPVQAVQTAQSLLKPTFTAIDAEGNITGMGRQMVSLPIHPRGSPVSWWKLNNLRSLTKRLLPSPCSPNGIRCEESPMNPKRCHDCDLSDKVERLKSILSNQQSPHRHLPAIKNAKRDCRTDSTGNRPACEEIQLQPPDANQPIPGHDSHHQPAGSDHPLQRALLSAYPDRVARRREDDPRKGLDGGWSRRSTKQTLRSNSGRVFSLHRHRFTRQRSQCPSCIRWWTGTGLTRIW